MSNKDLIKQYVSTGAILPEYQVNKLTTNNLKSYLRRRLQQADGNSVYKLRGYEFLKLNNEGRKKYFTDTSDLNSVIDKLFRDGDDIKLISYIIPLVKGRWDVNIVYRLLEYTPKEHRLEIVKQIIPLIKDKWDNNITNTLLRDTPKEHNL